MDYTEARNYIDNTGRSGICPGTEVIRELLTRLGNPEKELTVIHVAGTNGKGSICTYLEYGLLECGLKVGRYASPSVFRYLERIRLAGEDITEEEYAEAVTKVSEAAEGMKEAPTSFEAETAAAFVYFKDKKADVIIVECGMGGRDDATNVFDEPLACVFAPVSMDHMSFLGDDPEKIALNKAGIIKKNTTVIISDMPHVYYNGRHFDPASVIREEALKSGADCFGSSVNIIPEGLHNPLSGYYQKANLNTALLAFQVLEDKLCKLFKDRKISFNIFCKGIENARWPGRYERVCSSPVIIRDGSHNPGAALALKEALNTDKSLPDGKKIHLIMGVFKDKDYESILQIMLPCAVSFTAIDLPDSRRGLPAEELVAAAEKIRDNCSSLCTDDSRGDNAIFANNDSDIRELIGPAVRGTKDIAVHGAVDPAAWEMIDPGLVIGRAGSLAEALEPAFSNPDPEDVYVVFGSLSIMQLFGGVEKLRKKQ